MNHIQNPEPIVKEIEQRLSLRQPQKTALEILQNVMANVNVEKNADIVTQLAEVQALYPTVQNFDRDFLSLCFALATGVGKTRLMGAFIAFLYKAYGIRNFMVIAPNLTIYKKLYDDFTPGTPKYVFQGIDVFNQHSPLLVTGDNYQSGKGVLPDLFSDVVINLFNISKLTAKDKGKLDAKDERAKLARIRRISEMIGESYFDYLASRPDLVVIMDESHRYRAEAGAAAINELKPVLGLELTATPRIIDGGREIPFRNIIQEYNLSAAILDGFVKDPAIGTRKGFVASNYEQDSIELEHLKLNDGIFFHEQTKVALNNYAHNHNEKKVKPFMLVVADDKAHADELEAYLTSKEFQDGAYADKVIKVYSGMKAEEEEKMIAELLEIEKPNNTTEIVIHVNKLSEGWDVTNLYTIVPLRAANSVNLVEQSIGRGLRLPYGRRTGEDAIDTVTIVSHDNYAKIIEAAQSGKLHIMKSYIIGENVSENGKKTDTVTPALDALIQHTQAEGPSKEAATAENAVISAANANTVHSTVPDKPYIPQSGQEAVDKAAPASIDALPEVKSAIEAVVQTQKGCDLSKEDDRHQVVEKINQTRKENGQQPLPIEVIVPAISVVSSLTIDIPKIEIKPRAQVRCGYQDFELDTAELATLLPVDDKLKVTTLGSQKTTFIEAKTQKSDISYGSLIIQRLCEKDDIDYDECGELLQKLVSQVFSFLEMKYDTDNVNNILRNNLSVIAELIYKQVIDHVVMTEVEYDSKVYSGYFKLTESSIAIDKDEIPRDYRVILLPGEKQRIKSMVFTGFSRCLYEKQKFDSDEERGFAGVLENSTEVQKWFRPSLTNFKLSWQKGYYYPDFIVETNNAKYICEVKSRKEMDNPDVKGKMIAALLWCKRASNGLGASQKHWHYLFIPHDQIDASLDFDVAISKFRKDVNP